MTKHLPGIKILKKIGIIFTLAKIQENTLESLSTGIGGGVKAQDNFSKKFTKILKDSLKSELVLPWE